MATGQSAAQTVSFGGATPSAVLSFVGLGAFDPLAEVDLNVNIAGLNLNTDPAGNVLMVSAGVFWVGKSAAVVLSDVTYLGIEGGGILGTEDGGSLALG